MTYGYSSFARSWSLNVSGKGPIKKIGDVAGSFGYSEEEFSDRSSQSIYAVAKKGVHTHTFAVNPFEALLDERFKTAVLNVTDLAKANLFIRQYGTHFPLSILYGGQYSAYLKMEEETFSQAKRFGVDVSGEVSKSTVSKVKTPQTGGGTKTTSEGSEYGGKVSFGYSQGSTEFNVFSKTQSKYQIVGGTGGHDNWTIDESNASPIESELDFIYNLIDPRVFKDDSDVYRLFKSRDLIRQATETYLDGKVIGKPLPLPQIYTIILSKIQVTEEVDDANKQTRGTITGIVADPNVGNGKVLISHNLWQEDQYSNALEFRKGNVINPNRQFSLVIYPNPNGSFGQRFLKLSGSIREKDDLWIAWDNDWKSSVLSGESSLIDIGSLKLRPGEQKSQEVTIGFFNNHLDKGEMKLTFIIRRDMPEFWDGSSK